jgi:hypothetical protein
MSKDQVFWVEDPAVLMNKDYIREIWPQSTMDPPAKLNAITRFIILATILGYLITSSFSIFILGGITLGIIVMIYNFVYKGKAGLEAEKAKEVLKTKEGFANNIDKPEMYDLLRNDFTTPKTLNPLMNPLLPEIGDNPHRKNAAPSFNPAVESEINEATKRFVSGSIDTNASNVVLDGKDVPSIPPNHTPEETYGKLFGTLGDNAVFEASMRQFHPVANTRIPNDQNAFAKFCYGDMKSCKEGNEFACGRINSRLGQVVGQ